MEEVWVVMKCILLFDLYDIEVLKINYLVEMGLFIDIFFIYY